MNKIAIIDDNLIFRKITKMHLKKLGFLNDDILIFKNGKEIYDFIKTNIDTIDLLPKILFLDLNMPIMDGWAFLKLFQLFRKEYNYKPIIYILTSSVDDKDFNEAMNITAVQGYLVKPINAEALYKIVTH